ncbi:MAG TPA: hypothetical protein PLI88_08540 [Bacillota bacterium]|nr:hypothetical protein [Bacillota bacterium]
MEGPAFDAYVHQHLGQIVLEKTGSEKEKLTVDDILKVFTDISIECGN